MKNEIFDIAVVGAGAAGLMTAIAAARDNASGLRIILLDSREKIGAKILISGGTRCNVTNVKVTPFDYHGGPPHFVKHVLEAFTPDQTMQFFEEIGVPLVLEPTGKYFPTTHSGKTVLDALMKETEKVGVSLKRSVRVSSIKKQDDHFILHSEREDITACRVILTTGGLSYPETGSDGTGYAIAKSFGHSIVRTVPALTPLETNDAAWQSLSGVTLDAKLSFFRSGKKKIEHKGSFLFTHFGFSGPAALDVSRHFAECDKSDKPRIEASFLPEMTEEGLKKAFEAFRARHPKKMLKSFFMEEFGLPERFLEVLFGKINADPVYPIEKCRQRDIRQLTHSILNYPLEVTGVIGYKKAEVTAGGVDLKEVRFSTMESKLMPGLYFAGEILDVDGRIGGFNFQWSWSSGAVAGRSAAKSLSS